MAAFQILGLLAFALIGCGRVGFDPAADAGAAADAAIDVPLGPLCDRVTGASYCSELEGGALDGATNSGLVAAPGAGWMGTDGFRATPNPGQMPRLGFDLPAVVTTGELHIGARMFLAAGPPSTDYVVVAQTLTSAFDNKISFDINSGDRIQLVNDVDAAGGRSTLPGTLPRGRWFCFELAIVVAPLASGGRVDLLVDGVVALSAFQDLATTPPGGFFRAELGLFSSVANTNTEDAVFDNWIVANQAIGCP